MTRLVYKCRNIEKPIVETLEICKESIRINTPASMIELVMDKYREEKFYPVPGKQYIHSLDYHRYILHGFLLIQYIFWLPGLDFYRFENGQLVVICESDYGVKYAADLFYNRGRDNEDRVIYCDERALLQLRRFDNSVMIDFGRIDTPPLRHLNTFLMTVLKEEKTEKFPVLMESEYQKYLDNIWLPPEEDYYDEDTLSIPSSNLKKAFMKLLTKKRSPK